MKRRVLALLLVLAIVACAAIGLAACNEGGKDGGGGAGDRIFTEDASLAEITAALEGVESFYATTTYSYTSEKESYTVSYTGTYSTDIYFYNYESSYGYHYDIYEFEDGGCVYSVTLESGVPPLVEKTMSRYYMGFYLPAVDYLEEYYITEKNGCLAFDDASLGEGYVEGSGYVRCEAGALFSGFEEYGIVDDTSEDAGSRYKAKYECVISGFNAEYPIPEEVEAMKEDAVWARDVRYNGGYYEYGEYEGEECYYYLYGAEDEREETINGLPVRER